MAKSTRVNIISCHSANQRKRLRGYDIATAIVGMSKDTHSRMRYPVQPAAMKGTNHNDGHGEVMSIVEWSDVAAPFDHGGINRSRHSEHKVEQQLIPIFFIAHNQDKIRPDDIRQSANKVSNRLIL
jgi:hypothetical protein